MRFVIDSSTALKWVVEEVGNPAAARLLLHELFAPDFVYLECANALWKYVQRQEITAEQAEFKLRAIRRINMQVSPVSVSLSEALRIGCSLGHPVYDCLYLALAETISACLVTADTRLMRKVAGSPYSPLVISLQNAATD